MRIFYPRYSRDEVVARLRGRMAALRAQLPVTRVVLFGSYATGRQTAASDIDLLVVYESPSCADAYAVVKKTLGLRGLEPHVYSTEEARAVAKTIRRMIRDGVLIFDTGTRDVPAVTGPDDVHGAGDDQR